MGYECVALITALKIILKGNIFVKTLLGKHSALYKHRAHVVVWNYTLNII